MLGGFNMLIHLSNEKTLCINSARLEWLLFTKDSPIIALRTYNVYKLHWFLHKRCIIGKVGNYTVLIRLFQPYRRDKYAVYNVLLGKELVFKTDNMREFLRFGGFKNAK
jgi:hypothetical protein